MPTMIESKAVAVFLLRICSERCAMVNGYDKKIHNATDLITGLVQRIGDINEKNICVSYHGCHVIC